MTSSTRRVLRIPELIFTIFEFLDHKSNARNARVCHAWVEIALEIIWKEVDSLYQLFGVLGRLKRAGGEFYEFESKPDAVNWLRFETYARRVKSLRANAYQLKQSVFDCVDGLRREPAILPNLQALEWNAPMKYSSLFMHSKVKKLCVSPPFTSLPAFFQEIVNRLPNMSTLDILTGGPAHVVVEDLACFLYKLPQLTEINLPRSYFTTETANALSHMQHLRSIQIQCSRPTKASQSIVSHGKSEGLLCPLHNLRIETSFEEAIRIIEIPFSTPNLTRLDIDSGDPPIESSTFMRRLISAVSSHRQLVKEIRITSANHPCQSDCIVTEDVKNLKLDIFRPLFRMSNLTSFEMTHQYPLNLAQSEIEIFATSCPAMENLMLNVEPVHLSDSCLTLDALVPFAQHCSQLKRLGLFVDATDVPETTPTASFKSLRQLAVGLSIIDNEAAPSLYLAHLLAAECTIGWGASWEDCTSLSSESIEIIEKRSKLWASVNRMVPMLCKKICATAAAHTF
ncbi:hypothetical protein HYPSUDRAFT_148782 [Hypholoma sublateritium FD-334 SS-4]|uniref:F-box domain-containing protein n=1 Tax=Hypholoma sublateritium (strain FD-334 SS-4) TaxID=945553 RepID=A0A0D2LXV1_HYPSF|nr:hypothetical protein HYPSUDRAFT_148782 [Hypholoma sublateritium FD-334 SS-4]